MIGEVIHTIIKSRGITQMALAKSSGLSKVAIGQIIKGHYYPRDKSLRKISDALNVPIPVLRFFSISEDDIPFNKRETYAKAEPVIKELLKDLFGSKMDSVI